MTKETVRLVGMRETEQALAALPKEISRRPLGFRVLRIGGEPIAKMARSLVRVLHGHLRESIDVKATLARSQAGDKGLVAPLEMYVGPGQHPQGITEEFGTFNQAPHPFLRPAWDALKMRALDLIGAALGDEIDKAAKRHERKLARLAKRR